MKRLALILVISFFQLCAFAQDGERGTVLIKTDLIHPIYSVFPDEPLILDLKLEIVPRLQNSFSWTLGLEYGEDRFSDRRLFKREVAIPVSARYYALLKGKKCASGLFAEIGISLVFRRTFDYSPPDGSIFKEPFFAPLPIFRVGYQGALSSSICWSTGVRMGYVPTFPADSFRFRPFLGVGVRL